IEEIDTEGGRNNEEREAEKHAFELIMQKKEQLLSFDEDVSFIFAHSALKEGWDNPNVFQICTLAQRYSERRKRQEIGRGMRLCVDQTGDRIQDPKVNVLTVIANESYEDFVKGLQTEYAEDGNALPPAPTDVTRKPAKRNESIYRRQEFSDFWNKLIKKTDYNILVNTEEVVKNVIAEFNKEIVSPPDIIVKKGEYISVRYEITAEEIGGDWAKIKIYHKSSDGNDGEIISRYKVGDDLSKELKDKAFEGFTVTDIREKEIAFSNKEILREDGCIPFETAKTALISQAVSWERDRVFPVFNLIDRVAEETFLTRKTIIRIFNSISGERRKAIFRNPEGFASAFIFRVKEVLSDHVARNIEYFLKEKFEHYNLDDIFPSEDRHPQRQLIKGSESSLYDYVQCESGVETHFVKDKLNNDRKVILYFKFPDSFKVKLPKIIGNYVPDWGIVRKLEDGQYTIELVRETKATLYENLLQFTNEKRKIWCAKKHFGRIGIDYRHIDDTIERWWESDIGEPPAAQEMFEYILMVDDIDVREKFVTHLPVYSLKAVATNFGKEEFIEQLGWVKADVRQRLTKDMFVAKIVGKSMEPTVKDGSWGIFRIAPAGTREGNIVLVNCNSVRDPESDGTYTLKRYHSEKENLEDGTWRHKKIVLSPDNKDFDDIVLENIPEGDFQVTAELLRLL
ncbi:MAG TPA: S24 family peptidase, partial [Syntrophorhabdus sp.]|nr:S24 family peptidase [Syntrophorhabdus sp.]